VLDALPKPEVMLPRAVGNVSWGIMRLDRTVERMPQLAQAKRPATVYLKRFYCDCIIESPEIVTDLIRLVGAERVLFGTDYPSSMRDARPIEFIQNLAEVSPADRAAILGSNAARAQLEWPISGKPEVGGIAGRRQVSAGGFRSSGVAADMAVAALDVVTTVVRKGQRCSAKSPCWLPFSSRI
jgi:hypothetical protein